MLGTLVTYIRRGTGPHTTQPAHHTAQPPSDLAEDLHDEDALAAQVRAESRLTDTIHELDLIAEGMREHADRSSVWQPYRPQPT